MSRRAFDPEKPTPQQAMLLAALDSAAEDYVRADQQLWSILKAARKERIPMDYLPERLKEAGAEISRATLFRRIPVSGSADDANATAD